jgi:TolB-like protein/Tfp pilus assembly protein PilF
MDKRLVLAPFVLAVIALGGFFGFRYFTAKQIESIAVLPFVNESGNPDVEYLSDGMTETLISSLTKLPNLNVKSRSSVFRYKGKQTAATTIGNELNVQSILIGRVAQRGDQLTLSLELVDVSSDNAIWSQQYNRKQSDLVSLQSEIARDVSGRLIARMSGDDVAKIERNYTADPEAYQLYLKGRFQWNKRTGESLKHAVEFFEQAIAKDPNYALPFSGMAETYVLFPNYSVATPAESMPKAKVAALRAIELDDSLAEAHVALGMYYSDFAWNQPASEREFRRAIELNPNYATAHHQFGIQCLTTMGRFDEAVAEGRLAEQLDPVSPIIGADLGNTLIRARRFDEAIAQLHRVLALDPNFWVAHWYLGIANFGKGQYAESIAAYEKALSLNDDPWVKALLAQSRAKAGRRDDARRLVDELIATSKRRYVSNASLAVAHAAVGEKERAFALLEEEVADRSARPNIFAFLVIWDDLRQDPRFAVLVQKVEQSKLD